MISSASARIFSSFPEPVDRRLGVARRPGAQLGEAPLDAGHRDASTYCAMAKRFATDIGFAVCNEALQLHGGYGYMREYPIARAFVDARVQRIYGGTSEVMKTIIAKDMGL